MTIEQIQEQLKVTRGLLDSIVDYEGFISITRLQMTVESLVIAVEALAAHVASQATDGK